MSDIAASSSSSSPGPLLFWYNSITDKELATDSSDGKNCNVCNNKFEVLRKGTTETDLSALRYTAGKIDAHRFCLELGVQYDLKFSTSAPRKIEILNKDGIFESRFGRLGLHSIKSLTLHINDRLRSQFCAFLDTSISNAKLINCQDDVEKMKEKIDHLQIDTLVELLEKVTEHSAIDKRQRPTTPPPSDSTEVPSSAKKIKTHNLELPPENPIEVEIKINKIQDYHFVEVTYTLNGLKTTNYLSYYKILGGDNQMVILPKDPKTNSLLYSIEVGLYKPPLCQTIFIFVKSQLKNGTYYVNYIPKSDLEKKIQIIK